MHDVGDGVGGRVGVDALVHLRREGAKEGRGEGEGGRTMLRVLQRPRTSHLRNRHL